jgi:hypothetical protein
MAYQRVWHRSAIVAAALILAVACGSAGAHRAASSSGSGSNHLTWSGHTWRVKDGTGNLGQRWSASHTSVKNGVLTVVTSGGVGGGVGETTDHTYGTYSIRYRMTAGSGSKYAILLWPANGSRPEIDIAEDSKSDPTRSRVMATWHPKPGCTSCIQMRAPGDFTQWHTATLHWTSGGLTFDVDGHTFGHVSASSHVPMHLSIQTNAFASGPSTTLQVANVSAP